MAACIMTVEFGTIHYYFALVEYSEALQFFEYTLKEIGNYL